MGIQHTEVKRKKQELFRIDKSAFENLIGNSKKEHIKQNNYNKRRRNKKEHMTQDSDSDSDSDSDYDSDKQYRELCKTYKKIIAFYHKIAFIVILGLIIKYILDAIIHK